MNIAHPLRRGRRTTSTSMHDTDDGFRDSFVDLQLMQNPSIGPSRDRSETSEELAARLQHELETLKLQNQHQFNMMMLVKGQYSFATMAGLLCVMVAATTTASLLGKPAPFGNITFIGLGALFVFGLVAIVSALLKQKADLRLKISEKEQELRVKLGGDDPALPDREADQGHGFVPPPSAPVQKIEAESSNANQMEQFRAEQVTDDELDTLQNLQHGEFFWDNDYKPVVNQVRRFVRLGWMTAVPGSDQDGEDVGHGQYVSNLGRAYLKWREQS